MTAIIVYLAGWRTARARFCPVKAALPPALDVALDHVVWLRMEYPEVAPQTVAALIGAAGCISWAQVVLAYAAAWEKLPEKIRRAGDKN